MKRREFISLLGGAAAAWPLAARAQQPVQIAKIGHIESGLPSTSPNLLAAFRQGLRELCYVEGQNFFIERRYGVCSDERLPPQTYTLSLHDALPIFAIGPPQALAAAKATNRIPIVFVGGGDPRAIDHTNKLQPHHDNVTGLTLDTNDLASKRMQLLKDVVPTAKHVARPARNPALQRS